MAISLHLCVLFMYSFVSVKNEMSTEKVFFCRDPDTGNQYSVNSTWQSTTFCGIYTCKLRQINQNSKIEEFERDADTNVTESHENTVNNTINNVTKTVTLGKSIFRIPSLILQESSNISEKEINDRKSIDDKNVTDDKDRYLTESEIKTISEMLQTVKKSDLDAIVEVYNLAQDLAKEMDVESKDKLIDETLINEHDETRNESNPDISDMGHKHTSYWYEPLHNSNNKEKAVDMEISGTNTVNKIETNVGNTNSYFKGNLISKDLRKVPYYYPISSFQSMASYNPTQQYKQAKPTCKNQSTEMKKNYVNVMRVPGKLLKKPYAGELQKIMQPPILLPYPFSYIHHYNVSSYPYNINFENYPWINSGFSKKNYLQASQKQMHNSAALPQPINVVLETERPLLEDNMHEILTSKTDTKPIWQTEQLGSQILDEVKANIEAKSKIVKAFPFRKKVKLEKVGKVIKLDEMRSKRSANDSSDGRQETGEAGLFEVFLERTICESDILPGFFKIGNQSLPYPECCPQRIKPVTEE